MKTVIEMARAVYGANTEWSFSQLERLDQFAALVRADAIADERDAVEEFLKEYDMVNSTFAKDFRARSNK